MATVRTLLRGKGGPRRKGRYPKEYKSWVLWEVAMPLAAPLTVFVVLLAYWGATHAPQFGVKALVSVSGSGDLFIFAAFLLINVGAKFRILNETEENRDFFVDGDIDADIPFGIAVILLLVYMGVRAILEFMATRDVDTYKFAYGSISVVIIVAVVVWIDSQMCKMHMKLLQRKANEGLVSNYYNQF
jgi:hypothetical protein